MLFRSIKNKLYPDPLETKLYAIPTPHSHQHVAFPAAVIKEMINKQRNSAAAGPSGISVEMLKSLTGNPVIM